ncbi:MAG TPA: SDR family NAD(P)-dependent oxidoreductase [Candidatus Saccharimonadales bacterium]|nr:SDR family NAD(P)-dependent oxidoreductase [Candidatus Saccharimonadales bacterium]
MKTELLNLNGKSAVVTGAGVGIGFGIAYRLAEAGANVMIADVNQANLDEAKSKLDPKGWKISYTLADVAKEQDIDNMCQMTIAAFGKIDILVNNAGIYPIKPMSELNTEEFDRIMSVNLRSVFMTTKIVSKHMIAKGLAGKIINITSIDALHPSMIGLAPYDASKHGVWGFTKNVALELAPHNISVNAIAPGGIITPGTGAKNGKVAPGMEAFTAKIPMKRFGEPDEIGKVALFLASDMSSYMTGSQVVVDGGVLLA